MNNTFKYIITKVAFIFAALLFGSTAFAQDGSVKIDKKVTQDPDPNGVYTISLEAYVTGSVTVTESPLPADIVLVLDYSRSMNQDIGNLRSSVKDFVDIIKTSDEAIQAKDKDELGGHRIAFVLYSTQVYEPGEYAGKSGNGNIRITVPTGISLNSFLAASDLKTAGTDQVFYGDETTSLISPAISTGTSSGIAMERARDIIAGQTYSSTSKRSKIVVFFTDGEPSDPDYTGWGQQSWGNPNSGRTKEATKCIAAAYTLKNSLNATVYSVGLLSSSDHNTQVSAFLKYTSSDEKNMQAMPTTAPTGGWPDVSGDKSIIVTNSSALANIFSSIASSAGGDYSASSASSVLIDVVATSFAIPTDADLGSVQVYKVKCTQASRDAIISFDDAHPENITSQVGLTTPQSEGGVENEVQVTGFDYGAEWCGWNDETNSAHGHKLVLTIPITVSEDAVGGPHVNTNTSDSKLIIKDAEGNPISTSYFPRPWIKVPVSLWIQKVGLLEDDSAVFNLRRTPYLGPDVDYTADDIVWEDWGEKVTCNKNTMNEDGIVKVSGLSPDYIYKIYEDAWGKLGYTYEDDDAQYSVGDNVENPFIFRNTPKKVVFDEATVRNVFKKKEKATDAK